MTMETAYDFREAFLSGVSDVCGTYARTMVPCATVGSGGGQVSLTFENAVPTKSMYGFFRITADGGAAEFKCRTDGWEEWQAVDAGRDFGKIINHISERKYRNAESSKK